MDKAGMIYKVDTEAKRDFKIVVGFNAISEDFMKDFRKYFYNFYTVEDHVAHIASIVARFGNAWNLEGYKNIIHDGYDIKFNKIKEEDLHNYINVIGSNDIPDVDVDIY